MRRLAIPFVAFALVAGCGNDSAKPTRTLVLLHTNDEHSHLLGFQPEQDDFPTPSTGSGTIKGGAARRMTLLTQERAKVSALGANAASLTVSGGDNSMGTLTQVAQPTAAPDFTIMKQLGYDVTAWGNHEFDFGPKGLAQAEMAAQANGGAVPTVSTNIHFSATDAGDDDLAALFDETGKDASKPAHRYWVVTATNGLKVGFVGVMGADAAQFATVKAPITFSIPAGGVETNRAGVLTQIVDDVQPVVDTLRNVEKCDVVVALSHSGVDPQAPETGEDYLLAQKVNGLDVVVSAHTHTVTKAFAVTNAVSGKQVVVQEAGSFGELLGKITLTVDGSGVHWDQANTTLLNVDDSTAADATIFAKISDVIAGLESTKLANGKSYLENALTNLLGMGVNDDASKVGDLYFYPLATTSFDLAGGASIRKETSVQVLSADGMLAAADQYATGTTDVAVQVAGVIRGDLPKGKTGQISFGDVFRVLPLGISSGNGSIGYPILRASLLLGELKAALEASASASYSSQDLTGYFMVLGGAKYEFDTSRPPFNTAGNPLDPTNGRVTKITFATDHSKPDVFDHVAFDVANGGFIDSPISFITVVTNLYVAQFATSFGIKLKKPDGTGALFSTLEEAILKRGNGTEVKDYETLGAILRTQAQANGGLLPARWNDATSGNFPKRAICSGPLCTK
ncbi:MAG: Trifunctional nucleotide phosphoesterase protein YfkN [Myxococcales bacterium]|nr:Trifunctional nucleotide phosphoesterase protein YfkN [Myxococcales bacterium]